jgi:hypothetical protein
VSDRGRIWEAWGSDRIWREVGDCGDVRSVAAQGEVVLTFLGFYGKGSTSWSRSWRGTVITIVMDRNDRPGATSTRLGLQSPGSPQKAYFYS